MLSVFVRDLLVGCPKGAVFRVNKMVDKNDVKCFAVFKINTEGQVASVCWQVSQSDFLVFVTRRGRRLPLSVCVQRFPNR